MSILSITGKLCDVEKGDGRPWSSQHFTNHTHYTLSAIWPPVWWIFDHTCFVVAVAMWITSPVNAPTHITLIQMLICQENTQTLIWLDSLSMRRWHACEEDSCFIEIHIFLNPSHHALHPHSISHLCRYLNDVFHFIFERSLSVKIQHLIQNMREEGRERRWRFEDWITESWIRGLSSTTDKNWTP